MFTKILYDLIYMVPILAAVYFWEEQFVILPKDPAVLSATGIVILVLMILFRHLKTRLRFLIPLFPFVFGVVLFFIHKKEERISWIWANQWIFWMTGMVLACFLVGSLITEVVWARRAAAVFIIGILWCGLYGWIQISKSCAALLFFLLMLTVAEEIQLFWKKGGYTEKKAHLVYIAPFLILTGVLVFAIPASEKPYDWQFAVNIWNRISEGAKKTGRFFHRGSEDYAGVIGFSDEERGGFLGSLRKEKEPKRVMELSCGMGAGKVIYLRGKVLDTFDGQQWSDSYTEGNRDSALDSLETLCALWEYDGEHLSDYLFQTQVRIRYDEFNTKYLFFPLKMLPAQLRAGEEWYIQRGGSLLSSDTLGYGTEYEVSYLRMNKEHEIFRGFLEAEHETDPVRWKETVQKYANGQPQVSFEDDLLYKDRIYKIYLPQTKASTQVEEYLDRLFSDAGSDYDKLLKLEEVLGAFSYTDTPGSYPDEIHSAEEFLDYFLFRKQEGYCSHFATAFVLLARSQGIPARYVQGYYVTREEGEVVAVTSDMSHAWPEAYLDGVGWIPFEPTPGKKSRTAWAVEERIEENEGLTENHGNSGTANGDAMPEEMEDETMNPEEIFLPELWEEDETDGERTVNWLRVLLAAFISFCSIVIFVAADRIIVIYRYRRMDNCGKFRVMCRRNFNILKYLGFTMNKGETLQEFKERISCVYPEFLLSFVEYYEIWIYGEKEVTEEMRLASEKENTELKKILQSANGFGRILSQIFP